MQVRVMAVSFGIRRPVFLNHSLKCRFNPPDPHPFLP